MITIKLILYDVVEHFKKKEDKVVVDRWREQEPWRRERLNQMN